MARDVLLHKLAYLRRLLCDLAPFAKLIMPSFMPVLRQRFTISRCLSPWRNSGKHRRSMNAVQGI